MLTDDFPRDQNPYADAAPAVSQSLDEDEADELAERQSYVNRLLSRGVIFSIFWVFGLGSFYSLYIAWKAHRLIRDSRGLLYGMGSVWFCYILGGIGASLFAGVLTAICINATRV